MNKTLAKRLNSLEARLSSQKEPLMLMRVFVAPDRDLSPEITGIQCNGEYLPRLEGEARDALHERAFAHFKPVDAGGVVQLAEVF
ncbi:MAG TPA: hypothetical protein PLM98_07530 [Thiolinea sp.]|nr:hypothetical protein [Thiolinea sp.]